MATEKHLIFTPPEHFNDINKFSPVFYKVTLVESKIWGDSIF